MPLSTTFAGLSARTLGLFSGVLAKIYDNFARVTSGSLGNAVTGQLWTAVTGVWYANGGVAQTATAASSYPQAAIAYKTNPSISLANTSPGSGISFWQSDAGDWWGTVGSVSEVTTSTGTCHANSCCTTYSTCADNPCCTGSNTCVSNSCCSTTSTQYYCSTPCSCPSTYNGCSYVSSSAAGGILTCNYSCCVSNSCCTGSNTCADNTCCTGCSTCGCNSNSCCTTTYTYTYTWTFILKIIQSVASTISTIVSGTMATFAATGSSSTPSGFVNQILGITVGIVGKTITAKAFSDSGFTTLLGTLTDTVSATPTATGVGIILSPVDSTASTNQGATVGTFSAQ